MDNQLKLAKIQMLMVVVTAVVVLLITKFLIAPAIANSGIANVAPILVPLVSVGLSIALINAITIVYLNSWLDDYVGSNNILLLLLPIVPDMTLGSIVRSFEEDTRVGTILKIVSVIQAVVVFIGIPLMKIFVGFYVMTVKLQIFILIATLLTFTLLILRSLTIGTVLYSCRDFLTIYNVKKFKLVPIIFLVVLVAYIILLPILNIVGIGLPRRLFNIILLALPLVLPVISFLHTRQVRIDLMYNQSE